VEAWFEALWSDWSMKRYLRLLKLFIANSVQLELEYRANFIFNIGNSLITTSTGFLVLYAMFTKAEAVGGWSFNEVLVLYGIYMIFEALVDMFLFPNLSRMSEYIRKGDMDFFLLKPISSQFMVSVRYIRIWMLPQLLLAFALMGYGMQQLGQLNISNLASLALLLCSALVIVYALWFIMNTTAFYFVKVENISELWFAFFQAASFPISAFPSWARFVLTFIVPIAFITTVPASAAIGKLSLGFAGSSFLIAGLLFFFAQCFWRFSIANYTSASS
jgi:ABC-2 type transport system permease protein